MAELNKQKILKGRQAVDAYRAAHASLYTTDPRGRSIPDEHTPLLETMLAALKKQGFNSLDEFFAASEQLNHEEAGLAGKTELTEADRKVLEGMWR